MYPISLVKQGLQLLYTVYGLISRGEIFVDWIVKTFRGYIYEDYNQIGLENTMNSIIIPSIESLKFLWVKSRG